MPSGPRRSSAVARRISAPPISRRSSAGRPSISSSENCRPRPRPRGTARRRRRSSRSSSSAKSTPRSSAGGGGGADGVVDVLVGLQGLGVDAFVELRRLVGLVLEAVVLGLGALAGFSSSASSSGSGGAGADPAVSQRFFGVELGAALGAVGRAAAQIVEFALAVGANLLCAQFGIGQCGDLLME